MTDHLFTEAILNNALDHFGIDKNSLKKHEGFCSYVFEGKIKNQEVILKLSHSSRIKKEYLASELAFVLHLKNHNVKICPALSSYEDILEIADADGELFYVYLYQKVKGSDFGEKEDKTESDLQEVGRILASLHKASLSFNCDSHKRLTFIEREFVDYKKIIPPNEIATHQCFDKIINDLNKISKNNLNYGMTHGDSHDGNFLIHEKEIAD